MKEYYYKIVPIEDTESIMEKGLISDDKEIFVADILEQLPSIAFGQIGLYEYSILKINSKGITGKIKPDNVLEAGAGHQFIIKQSFIEPKYIEHIEVKKWNKWELVEHCERRRYIMLGMSDESITRSIEFMARNTPEWLVHYNNKYNKSIEALIISEQHIVPKKQD